MRCDEDRFGCTVQAGMPSVEPASARVHVLQVPVDPVTVDELHRHLLRFVGDRAKATVLHANVHAVNLAADDKSFASILSTADLVFCDGHGVMLGARLLGQRIPVKITYADWTWDLAGMCEREDLSIYLLGSRPGVAAAAAARLRDRHLGLRIAGTHHGYFDHTAGGRASLDVVAQINAARPDLVLVGFGMPLQESWIAAHRGLIDAAVVLSAGAAFDYVSGQLRRPPRWMTNCGLEWMGRLLIEPRRLARRYVAGSPTFMLRVLRHRLRRARTAR